MGLSDWIEERANSVQNFASGIAGTVATGASAVAGAVQSGIGSAAGAAGAAAQAMAERIGEKATSIAGTIGVGASTVAAGVQKAAAFAAAKAQATVGALAAGVQATAADIGKNISAGAGIVGAGLTSLVNSVTQRVQTGWGNIANMADKGAHTIAGGVGGAASFAAGLVGKVGGIGAGIVGNTAAFVDSKVQQAAAFAAEHGGPTVGAVAGWVAQMSSKSAAGVDQAAHRVADNAARGASIIAEGIGAGTAFLADVAGGVAHKTAGGLQNLAGRIAGGVGAGVAGMTGLVQNISGAVSGSIGNLAGMAAEFAKGRIANMAKNIGSGAQTFSSGLGAIVGGIAGLIGKGSQFVAGIVGSETRSVAEFLQARVAAMGQNVGAGAGRIAGLVSQGAHGIASVIQQGMAFVSATTGLDIDALAARAQAGIESAAQGARNAFDFARSQAQNAAHMALQAAMAVGNAVMDGPMGPIIRGLQTILMERAAKAEANVKAMIEKGRQGLATFALLKAQAIAQAMAAKHKAREMMHKAVASVRQHPMFQAAERGFDIARKVGHGVMEWGVGKVKRAMGAGRQMVGRGVEWLAENGPTIMAKARGVGIGAGVGAGLGMGVGALFGPLGMMAGGAIGGVVGGAVGYFGSGGKVAKDGELTGPFGPDGLPVKGLSAEAAIAGGATIFVNGINTSYADHQKTAARIAHETGANVVGIFNASGVTSGKLGQAGMLRDVFQVVGDKMFDAGKNPATATLKNLILKYGDASKKHGGLKIEAHSQGSVIVSEALREVAASGKSIEGHHVTTWGNASFTFPAGPEYHHRVHDGDPISTYLGTNSRLSKFVNTNPLAKRIMEKFVGPMANATADTRELHHTGTGITPHFVDQGVGKEDYLTNRKRFEQAESKPRPAPPSIPKKNWTSWLPPAVRNVLPSFLQRKGDGLTPKVDAGALRDDLIARGGQGFVPSADIRSKLQQTLGYDLGGVRLHNNFAAAAAARALGAEAFTVGRDVFFGTGRFDPNSPEGLGLLGHELTHVVQQTGNDARFKGVGSGQDAMEEAARQVGALVTQGFRNRNVDSIGSASVEVAYDGIEKADQARRLDAISEQAVAEATRRLESLKKPDVRIETLEVDIELDLDRMSDIECVDRWADAIVAAASAKGRSTTATPTATMAPTVQAYESGEHSQFGTDEVVKINGVDVTHNEMIAMGDLFKSPEAMLKASPERLKKTRDLIRRDRQHYLDGSAEEVTTDEWQDATEGEYINLASANDSHFSPDNLDTWHKYHAQAFKLAQQGKRDEAIATSAFSDHWLTDSFSAGHLFKKHDAFKRGEDSVAAVGTGPFVARLAQATLDANPELYRYEINSDPIKSAASDSLAKWGPMNPPSLAWIMRITEFKDSKTFYSSFPKIVHDRLNRRINTAAGGVLVQNAEGKPWQLSGDGSLSKSKETLAYGKQAVAASRQIIVDALAWKTRASKPAVPWYKRPFTGDFDGFDYPGRIAAVEKFVPHPVKEGPNGQATVDDAMTKLTDANSDETLKALADLTREQLPALITKLTEAHVIRPVRATPAPISTTGPDGLPMTPEALNKAFSHLPFDPKRPMGAEQGDALRQMIESLPQRAKPGSGPRPPQSAMAARNSHPPFDPKANPANAQNEALWQMIAALPPRSPRFASAGSPAQQAMATKFSHSGAAPKGGKLGVDDALRQMIGAMPPAAPARLSREALQKALDACWGPSEYERFMQEHPYWTDGLPDPPAKLAFDAKGNAIAPPGWSLRDYHDFKSKIGMGSPHEGFEFPIGSGNKASYEMRSLADNGKQALPSAGTQAVYDQRGNLIPNEGTPDLQRAIGKVPVKHLQFDLWSYKEMTKRLGPIEGDRQYRRLVNAPMPDSYYSQKKWQDEQKKWEADHAKK